MVTLTCHGTGARLSPEGNGPVPQQEEFGSDQSTLADVYQLFEERFERQLKGVKSHLDKIMNELSDGMRRLDQRLAIIEQNVRQPRLAMEADVSADEKTRERTEGAATAVQAMHGDSFTAKRIRAGPTTTTSFGVKAEPPALPCRDDLVKNDAATPTSCLLPLEMRTLTAVGGLLSAGEAFTTTRITYYRPRLWFCPTEKTHSERTSTKYALYHSSSGRTSFLPPSGGGL